MPALSVCISLHPAAGTIMMPLFRCGKRDPGPKLPPWLSWAWRPGCIPGSRQPQGVWAREPETNMQSEYKRQLLPGDLQARVGTAPNPPITWPLPTQAGWRMRLEPRERGLALAVPTHPCGQGHATCQLPASSRLEARLEAAVTSALHQSSAPCFCRIRPHEPAPHGLKGAEQGPALPWASLPSL